MPTVYVTIGNSDNKLTQQEWAGFIADVSDALRLRAEEVWGEWFSGPDVQWQNACWGVELPVAEVRPVRAALSGLARTYRQDGIVWAPAIPSMITPDDQQPE